MEVAGGTTLPYFGYIEADIQVQGLPDSSKVTCLLLVVADTKLTTKIPVLLGTNVLHHVMDIFKDNYGSKFLQDAPLSTPWYISFRCMTYREKQLERNNYRLGVVKSAESHSIMIPPNASVDIRGHVFKELPYPHTCAVLQPTTESVFNPDLDISPSIVNFEYKRNGIVMVNLSNVTTNTIVIQPRSVVCELQPVRIEDTIKMEQLDSGLEATSDIMDKFTFPSNLDARLLRKGKDLLSDFMDTFSHNDLDLGHTTGVQHKIELENTIPFKQRHRRVPPAMVDEVRDHIKQLLACGVIRRSHSPWASAVVLARKKDNSLRMCIDYRQLNQRTIKDSYALPRIEEILDSLSGARYFSVLDMKSGYHQVDIAEEHKERTAFTVGPLGFF